MLKNLYIDTFNLVKNNLILVQPLLFYMLISGAFLSPLATTKHFSSSLIILLLLISAFFCAFLAGWLNMFHKTIENSLKNIKKSHEKTEHSMTLLKEFTPGVGQNFIKIITGGFIYLVLIFFAIQISGIISTQFIGLPESFSSDQVMNVLLNEKAALEFLKNLSPDDRTKLQWINLILFCCVSLVSYLSMFWAPAAISGTHNAFNAFLASFKTTLKRPMITFNIFISFNIALLVVNLIIAGAANALVQFFGILILVLSVIYFITMIFLYYERCSENNSTSWTDSFR